MDGCTVEKSKKLEFISLITKVSKALMGMSPKMTEMDVQEYLSISPKSCVASYRNIYRQARKKNSIYNINSIMLKAIGIEAGHKRLEH